MTRLEHDGLGRLTHAFDATNLILDASTFVLVLTTLTMVGVTFAVTALALGFGALYPNFETENVAEIPTSFGGLLFMMAAVLYLAGVVVLEAWRIVAPPPVAAPGGTGADQPHGGVLQDPHGRDSEHLVREAWGAVREIDQIPDL